jgi:hypothetical protein
MGRLCIVWRRPAEGALLRTRKTQDGATLLHCLVRNVALVPRCKMAQQDGATSTSAIPSLSLATSKRSTQDGVMRLRKRTLMPPSGSLRDADCATCRLCRVPVPCRAHRRLLHVSPVPCFLCVAPCAWSGGCGRIQLHQGTGRMHIPDAPYPNAHPPMCLHAQRQARRAGLLGAGGARRMGVGRKRRMG